MFLYIAFDECQGGQPSSITSAQVLTEVHSYLEQLIEDLFVEEQHCSDYQYEQPSSEYSDHLCFEEELPFDHSKDQNDCQEEHLFSEYTEEETFSESADPIDQYFSYNPDCL